MLYLLEMNRELFVESIDQHTLALMEKFVQRNLKMLKSINKYRCFKFILKSTYDRYKIDDNHIEHMEIVFYHMYMVNHHHMIHEYKY